MYFKTSLLLFLLVGLLMVAGQDGDPVVHPSKQATSVLKKCIYLLTGPNLIGPQNLDLLPLKTLCHPNFGKYLDCMSADIYKSNATIDIQLRSVTDFSKVKTATDTVCRDAPKLKDQKQICNTSAADKCGPYFKPSGPMNRDSPSFCKLIKDIRCTFNGFASCDLQQAMLLARYQHESQSIGCLLSDPKIKLVPFYGPELKCYSSINVKDLDGTDYMELYEHYCKQFNYSEVRECIEKTFENVTSEELWEDKETYLKKARRFLGDRRALCNSLKAIPNRKCLIPTHKPDVSICRKMFFYPPGPSKFSVSENIKFYAYCVWSTYMSCNLDVSLVIYRNLISYFE